ncbi:MAG: radical SAM protein [Selenomonadaceae bacterium]|nr:radical SAM protein [Selenomonadaceae bacterium]
MNLNSCDICPRLCKISRYDEVGYCGAGAAVKVAQVMLHKWEEPCISGQNGAGAIFFSHCNLRCVFCQNYPISHKGKGVEITTEKLGKIFLRLQKEGASTIDLVTPTHFAPQIMKALKFAKDSGLTIPVVYNSSGYERVETIEKLSGFIDVYMPDFKYFSNEFAAKYSMAKNYVETTKEAILAMYKQVGKFITKDGVMQKGLLLRHLVLPGLRHDSMKFLDWAWENFGDDIILSLMRQYTPQNGAEGNLARKLTTFEYESVVDYAVSLGFTNAYTQEKTAASKEFIPSFDAADCKFLLD